MDPPLRELEKGKEMEMENREGTAGKG